MRENPKHSFTHQSQLFYHELSYVRVLLIIQVHILVCDLDRGHLGSYDVIRSHQQVLANNSRLKRATGMGVVSLWLYCHNESTDMSMSYLGQHLTPRNLDLRSNIDLTILKSSCIWFDAPWREKHGSTRIKPIAFLVGKSFAKKCFWQKTAILCFFIPIEQTVDGSSNMITC